MRPCARLAPVLALLLAFPCASCASQEQELPVRDFDIEKVRNGDHYDFLVTQDAENFKLGPNPGHRKIASEERYSCFNNGRLLPDFQLPIRGGYFDVIYRVTGSKRTGVAGVKLGVYESSEGLIRELEWYFYQPDFHLEWLDRGTHKLVEVAQQYVFCYTPHDRSKQIAWVSRNFIVLIQDDNGLSLEDYAALTKAYLKKYPSSLRPDRISRNHKEFATEYIRRWTKDLDSTENLRRRLAIQQISKASVLDVAAFFGEPWIIELWVSHYRQDEDEKVARIALLMVSGHKFATPKEAKDWWGANSKKSREELVRDCVASLLEAMLDVDLSLDPPSTTLNVFAIYAASRLLGNDFGFTKATFKEDQLKCLEQMKAWWSKHGASFKITKYTGDSGQPGQKKEKKDP